MTKKSSFINPIKKDLSTGLPLFVQFFERIGAYSYLIPLFIIKKIIDFFSKLDFSSSKQILNKQNPSTNKSWETFTYIKYLLNEFIGNSKIIFSFFAKLLILLGLHILLKPVGNFLVFLRSFALLLSKKVFAFFSIFKLSIQIEKHPAQVVEPILIKKKKQRSRKTKNKSFFAFLFKKKFKVKKFIFNRYTLSLGLVVLFIVFFFYSFMLVTAAQNLPSPERLSETNGPLTTEIYDRNGKLLYRLYEGKNRTLVKLDTLPQHLINATIAIEDKHFYSHPGIDIEGMTRAARNYLEKGEIQGGGSTITQQLIKNTLLTPEQTIKRKTKEIILAFWTERIFSKQEILQMYFNEVAYGGPAWGITAAAQTYFDKEPKDLTLAEAAYLAGLPASPTTYSPYGANPELGKQRQLQVLRRMVEDGYITAELAQTTAGEKLDINPPIAQIKAPHFVMYVRQLLSQKYGERMVSQGGLKVTTTLDLNMQRMAEEVVAKEVAELTALNVSNGAAMITDAKTGQILAMVGSKNYFDPNGGNFNVTIAQRQPGSSIKPITYVTGFKQGFTPGNLLLDTPITFRNAWESYSPVNYDGKFHGAVTIRTALGSSYNIPAVKMLSMIGIPEMISTAKEMGITTFDDSDRYGLSLTLGGGEVKMTDMMVAYGTFAQNGIRYESEAILKVLDPQNRVLEDNSKPEGKRVLTEETSYFVNDILSDNKARTPAFGPNSLLNIPNHIVAVKTGTTDSKRDNWTFGYTPEYVVGVWVGNNNNSPMHPQLTSGVTGAAPIWHGIMSQVLKDRPNLAFERPAGVTDGTVDGRRDLVIAGQKPRSILARRENQSPDPTGKNQTITYTDPFSTITVDPSKPITQ